MRVRLGVKRVDSALRVGHHRIRSNNSRTRPFRHTFASPGPLRGVCTALDKNMRRRQDYSTVQIVLQHYTACKAPGARGPGHRGEWLRCRRCLSAPPIAQGGRQSVGGLQPNRAPQLIRGCRGATSELMFASPRPATLSGTRTAALVERDAQRCSVSTQLLQPYTCASTLALAGVTVCRRPAAGGRAAENNRCAAIGRQALRRDTRKAGGHQIA